MSKGPVFFDLEAEEAAKRAPAPNVAEAPPVPDVGIEITLVHRPELDRDPRISLLKEIFSGEAAL